jgi:hypothetical protein
MVAIILDDIDQIVFGRIQLIAKLIRGYIRQSVPVQKRIKQPQKIKKPFNFDGIIRVNL